MKTKDCPGPRLSPDSPLLPGSQRSSRVSKDQTEGLASRLAESSISGHQDCQDPPGQPPSEPTQQAKAGNKKKFAHKMRSIVSAVKTAQRLEVEIEQLLFLVTCYLIYFWLKTPSMKLSLFSYTQRSLHRATDATFVPKYASEDIIRSGHLDYNTLFADNEHQVEMHTGCLVLLNTHKKLWEIAYKSRLLHLTL